MRITDSFWKAYESLVRDTVIPYQWEILNDQIEGAEKSHAVENFKIAAGLSEGNFEGMVFQDSDIAKWLEAVGYALGAEKNPALESMADTLIEYMEKAQQPDGYLNTYYSIKEPDKRFTNLTDCHELYCLGHMIEGAIAYYQGTGKRKFLDIVCRYVDLVDKTFGPEEGKKRGYPGHEEIELALLRLYDLTKEEKYLNLARFFLTERGREPNYFIQEWEANDHKRHWGGEAKPELEYHQAHKPVTEQDKAVGHAVRAVYLYTGMAHLARLTGDKAMADACHRLWDNIADKQLYITGAIGQTVHGEAFTFDYDLPNDTVYGETCASIGLIFFGRQMLNLKPEGRIADVMERALYNTVLGGMSRDGKRFFYVNPLECWPEASKKAPIRKHVVPDRPGWYACACCPPNVARLIMSLGSYIYTLKEDILYNHFYIGNTERFTIKEKAVEVQLKTKYPWKSQVSYTITTEEPVEFTLALRLPGWAGDCTLTLNGENIPYAEIRDGYAHIHRAWSGKEELVFQFPMAPMLVSANRRVRANAGKVALVRGPIVYCGEAVDNGPLLSALSIRQDTDFCESYDLDLNGLAIQVSGWRDEEDSDELYHPAAFEKTETTIKLIPYYLWDNRGETEMQVWFRCGKGETPQ